MLISSNALNIAYAAPFRGKVVECVGVRFKDPT
jgi:hypothetical protein